MEPKEIAEWYEKQSITWLCYECVLPSTLFVFIWMGAKLYSQGIEHPYLSVFSTADLALFASLLFLGISKQFDDHIRKKLISENRFHKYKSFTLLTAILFLILYSIMKVAVLNSPTALTDANGHHDTLIAAACTSVTLAIVAVIACSVLRWKILDGLEPQE